MILALEKRKRIAAAIVKPLLGWYDRNARILPWRENVEPYRVWVSEIMLQQTRVEAVKPFYERFLHVLPTVKELATVSEEHLLKLWEGLGYYNRARNLQKAARILVGEYGGFFPRSCEELRKLPGVGEYTAGAIASICFGLPTPAIDGNVLRVFSRLFMDSRDIARPTVKQELSVLLHEVYPVGRCGDFTQSLMELGALICLPAATARCETCPLIDQCLARREGREHVLPHKAAKKKRRQEKLTVLLLGSAGRVAVCKRGEGSVLAGLWEFPNVAGALTEPQVRELLLDWGVQAEELQWVGEARHIFTHVEWDLVVCRVACREREKRFRWVTLAELDEKISLPTAFRKLIPMLSLTSGAESGEDI